jgi:hypothetical protein
MLCFVIYKRIKSLETMDLIKVAEETFATKKEFPEFNSGDTITVSYCIKEGNRERSPSEPEAFARPKQNHCRTSFFRVVVLAVQTGIFALSLVLSSCGEEPEIIQIPETPTTNPPVEKVDTTKVVITSVEHLRQTLPELLTIAKQGKTYCDIQIESLKITSDDFSALDSLFAISAKNVRIGWKDEASIAPNEPAVKITSTKWKSWGKPAIAKNGDWEFVADEADLKNFEFWAAFIGIDNSWKTGDFNVKDADEFVAQVNEIIDVAKIKPVTVIAAATTMQIYNRHAPSIGKLIPHMKNITLSFVFFPAERVSVNAEFVKTFADNIHPNPLPGNAAIFAVAGVDGANDVIGLKNSQGNALALGTDSIGCGPLGLWAAKKTKTFFPNVLTVEDHPVNATDIMHNLQRFQDSGLTGEIMFYRITGIPGEIGAFVPAMGANGETGDIVSQMITTLETRNKKTPFKTVDTDRQLIDPVFAVYEYAYYPRQDNGMAWGGRGQVLDMYVSHLQFGTYNGESGSANMYYKSLQIANIGQQTEAVFVPYTKLNANTNDKRIVTMELSKNPIYVASYSQLGTFTHMDAAEISLYRIMLGFGKTILPNKGQEFDITLINSTGIAFSYKEGAIFPDGDKDIRNALMNQGISLSSSTNRVISGVQSSSAAAATQSLRNYSY